MNFKLIKSSEISKYCEYFRQSKILAVDTEFCRITSYWPKLALIQLSDGHETVLIDPLEKNADLTPVRDLFAQQDLVKIFHSCRQDLEIILKIFGELPKNIFDTQLAYTFLYPVEEVSLAKMLEEQSGIILNKSKQNANWMRRPLPPSQLIYAANDVVHLPKIKSKLLQKLIDVERYEWFREEQLTNFTAQTLAPTTDYWLRLAKRGNHKSHQLHILKAVCDWREEVAQELDYNRKRVLADDIILKIVETKTFEPSYLSEIPSSHRASVEDLWCHVISSTEDQWPARLKRKPMTLKEQEQLEQLRKVLEEIAADLTMSPKLIATTDELKSFIRGNHEVAFLKGWRLEVFGQVAKKI